MGAEKIQMNVYVPGNIDTYVDELHRTLRISKSDLVSLLLAYSRKFFTINDIKKMAGEMIILGEEGLECVRCKVTP